MTRHVSSLIDTITNLSYCLKTVKGDRSIDHLADQSGVHIPGMVFIDLCQTVFIWRPISRHVE